MLKIKSMKSKLVLLVLFLGTVPLILLGIITYNFMRDNMERTLEGNLQLIGNETVAALDEFILSRGIEVKAMTVDHAFQSGDQVIIRQNLSLYLENYDHYGWLGFLDGSGRQLADAGEIILHTDDVPEQVLRQWSLESQAGQSLVDVDPRQGEQIPRYAVFVEPVYHSTNGSLQGFIAAQLPMEHIVNIINRIQIGETGRATLFNGNGILIGHPDRSRFGSDMSHYPIMQQPVFENRNNPGDVFLSGDGSMKWGMTLLLPRLQEEYGVKWGIIVDQTLEELYAVVTALRNILLAIGSGAALLALFAGYLFSNTLVRPVQKINDITKMLSRGDFTAKADVYTRDELGEMAGNLNNTISVLNETLTRVQEASDNVNLASGEISSGNQDLSQRTEEQASSLEEIASTIEEVTSSLETTSANAAEADNLSLNTMESIRRSEAVVGELQGAMDEITKGSREISEIISTVNDIAFQTNLLALNAAVEAARAGEQGRGFAVVAAEVRNLAGRSAESAREIEKLIKDSIVRVDRGNNLMGDTEKVLQEIVVNTQKTSDVVGEIAATLREQTTAAGNIRSAIEELNLVTQQNSSLVEEIASSSENMSSEAASLAEQVQFFHLSSSGNLNKGKGKALLPPPHYNSKKLGG